MQKTLLLVGARPQFIKAQPLLKAWGRSALPPEQLVFVHSGQHYDPSLSKLFFKEFSLPEPDYHLNSARKSFGAQLGYVVDALVDIIEEDSIQQVVVFGDTNTTLAGALAATRTHTKLIHIEAGLRSGDYTMPEEVNRIWVDSVSDVLFAPSKEALQGLGKAGLKPNAQVFEVGDIMYDVLLQVAPNAKGTDRGTQWFMTLHRPGNTDSKEVLSSILTSVNRLAKERGKTVYFPMHPRTRKAVDRYNIDLDSLESLIITEPISYEETLFQIKNSEWVFTDSGGLQKEAFFLSKPVMVLRDTTEWKEIIEHGWGALSQGEYQIMKNALDTINPDGNPPACYGDGNTADLILKHLQE